MAGTSIDTHLMERLQALAATSLVPLAEMSMDEIANALDMTRMTLYRKAGTRDQIVEALRQVGVDVQRQPSVAERVVEATVELLRERPIADLTLELIATRARCSLPALHARFGGRVGVLKAVILQISPLVPMQTVIAQEMETDAVDLRKDVRLLYQTLYAHLNREWPLIRSILAELLRDPGGEIGTALRDWYLPQVTESIVPLLGRHMERGTMRRLPIPLVVQVLAAPMGVHVASRDFTINELGLQLPDPDQTIDILTDMFCRAVATDPTEFGDRS